MTGLGTVTTPKVLATLDFGTGALKGKWIIYFTFLSYILYITYTHNLSLFSLSKSALLITKNIFFFFLLLFYVLYLYGKEVSLYQISTLVCDFIYLKYFWCLLQPGRVWAVPRPVGRLLQHPHSGLQGRHRFCRAQVHRLLMFCGASFYTTSSLITFRYTY